MNMQGALTDVYGVSFAANATAFTPSVTQSDISSKACPIPSQDHTDSFSNACDSTMMPA